MSFDSPFFCRVFKNEKKVEGVFLEPKKLSRTITANRRFCALSVSSQ